MYMCISLGLRAMISFVAMLSSAEPPLIEETSCLLPWINIFNPGCLQLQATLWWKQGSMKNWKNLLEPHDRGRQSLKLCITKRQHLVQSEPYYNSYISQNSKWVSWNMFFFLTAVEVPGNGKNVGFYHLFQRFWWPSSAPRTPSVLPFLWGGQGRDATLTICFEYTSFRPSSPAQHNYIKYPVQ